MPQYGDMNKRQDVSQKMRADLLEGTQGYRCASQLTSAVALYLVQLLDLSHILCAQSTLSISAARLPSVFVFWAARCRWNCCPPDPVTHAADRSRLLHWWRGCFIISSRRPTYRGGDMPRAYLESGILAFEKTTLPIDIRWGLEHTEFNESAAVSFEENFVKRELRNLESHFGPHNRTLLDYLNPEEGHEVPEKDELGHDLSLNSRAGL